MKNDKLKFSKSKHVYSINGKELVSVTTLLSKFKTEFNASMMSKIISRCIQKEFEKIAVISAESMPKFFKLYGENSVEMFVKLIKERTGKSRYVTPTMVKKIWKQKNKDSQEHGTEVHLAIENYINGTGHLNFKFEKSEAKYKFATEYIDSQKALGYELIPEVKMYSEDLLIAGCCDVLIDKKNGYYKLADHKTNEKIEKESYKGQKMKAPINNLLDCNFYHYALQQSLYAIILEKEYDILVDEIEIPHYKEDGYEVISLPILKEECYKLLGTLKVAPIETFHGGVEL